jgi:hypothetical protein
VIGTFLTPKLAAFVKREQERLGIVEDENGNEVAKDTIEEPNADVESANNEQERIPTDDVDAELDR